MEKEFNLTRKDAAELLRDVADSIEGGSIALDGEDWKVYHETDKEVPMRMYSDDQGTEIGFKILRKKQNQA